MSKTLNTPVFWAWPIATLMPATVTGSVVTPADETTAGTEPTGGLVRVTWAVCPAWAWIWPWVGTRVCRGTWGKKRINMTFLQFFWYWHTWTITLDLLLSVNTLFCIWFIWWGFFAITSLTCRKFCMCVWCNDSWPSLTSLATCRFATVVPVSTAPGLAAATAASWGLARAACAGWTWAACWAPAACWPWAAAATAAATCCCNFCLCSFSSS